MRILFKSLFFVFFFSINLFAQLDFIDPSTTPFVTPNLSQGFVQVAQTATDSTGQYVYAIWQLKDGANWRVQVARSVNYGADWISPSSTPPGDSPNLSAAGEDGVFPQITTNSTGQYVYVTWRTTLGSNFVIEVAISSDYGDTWSYPTSTPIGSPILSASDATDAKIATDSTGANVYVTWSLYDGLISRIQIARSINYGIDWTYFTSSPPSASTVSPNLSAANDANTPAIAAEGDNVYVTWYLWNGTHNRIQIARSSDKGNTWNDPTTVPAAAGTIPNISDANFNAINPRIAADSTGTFVYVTWNMTDISGFSRIQVARSVDNGGTWVYPTGVPLAAGLPPNLSRENYNGFDHEITTDSTGKYVFATWDTRKDLITRWIEVARSDDYGDHWSYPISTPYGSPILSDPTKKSFLPQIATDTTGANVYITWQLNDGASGIIQVASSANHGSDWVYPTSTPTGVIPNLSDPTEGLAHESQIAVDSTGQHVYIVWNSGPFNLIQVAIGFFQPDVLQNIICKNFRTDLLLQRDYVDEFSWDALLDAVGYKMYFNSPKNLVYEGTITHYIHHGSSNPSTYYLTWVNDVNAESVPIEIHISR